MANLPIDDVIEKHNEFKQSSQEIVELLEDRIRNKDLSIECLKGIIKNKEKSIASYERIIAELNKDIDKLKNRKLWRFWK